MRTLVLAFAVIAAIGLAPLAAHPGHDHKMMGTIVSIDGLHVLMKTTDGHERTFALTDTTRLLKGKKAGSAKELKAGMRIVVNVGEGEEPLRAKELQYTLNAK